ncbi:leucine-rich repeat neuronal protein 3-like [Salarias fasciatus]|uniref:leucine-rich repeat neuronal protein 3-like n=1 Tax=Salarias fasciatus TaxID=181472 RepID=UPI001176B155|nr:leucine-rich repeat neuronal protein 3-like [Salarias fasciatus]
MKEAAAVACLLVELSLIAVAVASEGAAHCPPLCRCEIRPWFSPSSTYTEAATVDCNDLGLAALPERLPLMTQVLRLQANSIHTVRENLDYLANITEIDLSQNNISSLSHVSLGTLPQLLSLHMEENWIHELSDRCLASLHSLQELYLNHNLIFAISSLAFQGLDRLLRLHLNSNRLTSVSSQWFHSLPNLEILMLGENPVLRLTDMNFRPLANLRSLVLAGMNLTEIPDNSLVGLENLESVSFFDNLLQRVPRAALMKVQNLKFLDLNKNSIERIQKSDFVDMLHLKELGINSMPELVSIDAFALNNLPELTKIEATNNPRLSYIDPRAFYQLPRLETLMLNNNALSALHRGTVEALPGLQEVSLHSNPIRCDCVVRWINTNRTAVRFMEPDSLRCAEPEELHGRLVRQVHFREMTEICLPLISPGSLPERVQIRAGRSLSLHCRAFGEPAPDIYWATPSGDRLLPGSASEKHYLHPEGTLDLYGATEQEAGSYTCIAHNLVGADLQSVLVSVEGRIAPPSQRLFQVNIASVQSDSVTVSWDSTDARLSQLSWSALAEDQDPFSPFTARLPADVRQYHIQQLKPSTRYRICVQVTETQSRFHRDCVSVSTEDSVDPGPGVQVWDGLLAAACALLLVIVAAVASSLIYTSLYSRVLYRKLLLDSTGTVLTAAPPPSPSPGHELRVSGNKLRAALTDFPENSV